MDAPHQQHQHQQQVVVVEEEEDLFDQIDWDSFLDQLPQQTLLLDDDDSSDSLVVPTADHQNGSPDSVLSEIENLLFADDEDVLQHSPSDTEFDKLLAEILVDDPSPPPRVESDDGSSPSDGGGDSDKDRVVLGVTPEEEEEQQQKGDDAAVADADDADDESLSKKQKRQMRNRDAAVKSRERKKLYVRDLEIKSRYYEGECRRLGHLLQCCYAENHALRLCLQSRGAAFGAPMTMQESAVLLLESLLLGSLLWFMGIMCQLSLPLMLLLTEVLPRENMEQKKGLRKVVLKGPESKIPENFWVQSFVNSRRCQASRTKMKLDFPLLYYF